MTHEAFGGLAIVNGNLYCTYRSAGSHGVVTGASRGKIYAKTSSDNGATWSSAAAIIDDTVNQFDVRDNTLLVSSSGRVLLPHFLHDNSGQSFPYCGQSDDNGSTWSSVAVTSSFTGLINAISGAAVQLSNDRILVPVYGEDTGDTYTSVRISYSDDDGDTWAFLSEVADGETDTLDYQEPSLVILNSGDIGCMMRTGDDEFYWSTSSNSGSTWSTPVAVGFDSSGRPMMFNTGSTILLLYREPLYNLDTAIRQTSDDGSTWSEGMRLSRNSTNAMVYGQMCSNDGAVAIAYSEQVGQTGSATEASVYFTYLNADGTERL